MAAKNWGCLVQSSRVGIRLAAGKSVRSRRRCACTALQVLATYPIPETDKEPSEIDTPQEWITPQPSKRPDIFPDLDELDPVKLPNPLPGDPELPPDEEWAEKQKKLPDNDPDKEPPEEWPEEGDEEKEKKEEEGDEGEGEDDEDSNEDTKKISTPTKKPGN